MNPSLTSVLIAVVITVVVVWLMALIVPTWLAAVIGLIVFLVLINGDGVHLPLGR